MPRFDRSIFFIINECGKTGVWQRGSVLRAELEDMDRTIGDKDEVRTREY